MWVTCLSAWCRVYAGEPFCKPTGWLCVLLVRPSLSLLHLVSECVLPGRGHAQLFCLPVCLSVCRMCLARTAAASTTRKLVDTGLECGDSQWREQVENVLEKLSIRKPDRNFIPVAYRRLTGTLTSVYMSLNPSHSQRLVKSTLQVQTLQRNAIPVP